MRFNLAVKALEIIALEIKALETNVLEMGNPGMRANQMRALVMIALLGVSAGCVRVTHNTTPTFGEQITDLVKAKQSGAITEEEFKRLRQQVLAMI